MDIYKRVKGTGKEQVLELPIHVDSVENLSQVVVERLRNYLDIVQEYLSDYGDDFMEQLKLLSESLIKIFQDIDGCMFDKAYNRFKAPVRPLEFLVSRHDDNPFVDSLSVGTILYRARTDKVDDIKGMYHIPSLRNFNCSSQRFSEEGYPALYLCRTREGCEAEISELQTLAEYTVLEDAKLSFLDLTILKLNAEEITTPRWITVGTPDGSESVLERKRNIHLLWPIIACCYITYKDNNRKYKKEYTFPQFLSRYLREESKVDGIRYFTVKDDDLDSNTGTMSDYIFFTKQYDCDGFDKNLLSKFKIEIV